MSVRLFTTTSAVLLMVAGPAFADCQQEIASLEAAATEAATGADTGQSDMPASEHQQEVLSEDKEQNTSDASGAAGMAGTGESAMPATEHQQEVLEGSQGGGEDWEAIVAEAKDMAAAGDETGCMEKVTEAKSTLGMN
jgi:hypothetical protein